MAIIKLDSIPTITYLINNGGSNDIVCMNYVYMLKDKSLKIHGIILADIKGVEFR